MNSFVIYASFISLIFQHSNALNRNKTTQVTIDAVYVSDWKTYLSNRSINFECNANIEICNKTYNPFTANYCVVLMYFKTPVCGGLSCYFNEKKKKCDGQCTNTILQTCVSKVSNPTDNSDCVCASSRVLPTKNYSVCDSSTCYSNSCSLAYYFVNGISDGTLYATCNNDLK